MVGKRHAVDGAVNDKISQLEQECDSQKKNLNRPTWSLYLDYFFQNTKINIENDSL